MAAKQNHPRRFTIQTQLISLTLLVSLAITLVVWLSSMYTVYYNTRRNTLQAAEYGLRLAASNIAQNVIEVDNLASWCMVDATVQTYLFNSTSAASLTNNLYTTVSGKYYSMHAQRYIQRFLLYNGSAQILQFGTPSPRSRLLNTSSIRRLPYMEEDTTNTSWQFTCNDPLLSAGTARGIPITRTMYHASGKVGRVYLAISEGLVTESLRSYSLNENNRLYWVMNNQLYRIDGGTLAALGSAENTQAVPDQDAEAEAMDANTSIYKLKTEDGWISVVVYPLGRHGMYLAQSIPFVTWSQLPGLQTPALVTIGAIIALSVVLILLLRRVIATPIRALQGQLTRIAGGDFSTNPAIEWPNEMGDIGRGINGLADSVSALMDSRIEDEKQKQNLEYRMLQNQINPHFLYNTLNSIKWMATIQHAPGIAEMTTALSRLLKSVSKGNERLVPLQEEFALLNDYFTIQQYRYGGTVTLDVTYIEDERLCRDCMIPRFTLQPLVENAIFHGIEPKGCAGSIELGVLRDKANGDVLIELKDDGVGMTAERIAKVLLPPDEAEAADKYRHVGMWNVHRRLQYSFGESYGLTICSAPGKGTTVTVRLPGNA